MPGATTKTTTSAPENSGKGSGKGAQPFLEDEERGAAAGASDYKIRLPASDAQYLESEEYADILLREARKDEEGESSSKAVDPESTFDPSTSFAGAETEPRRQFSTHAQAGTGSGAPIHHSWGEIPLTSRAAPPMEFPGFQMFNVKVHSNCGIEMAL